MFYPCHKYSDNVPRFELAANGLTNLQSLLALLIVSLKFIITCFTFFTKSFCLSFVEFNWLKS